MRRASPHTLDVKKLEGVFYLSIILCSLFLSHCTVNRPADKANKPADSGLPHYGHVATVAKSGGNYTDPVAAMNDLAAWCGSPSAVNTCLLKIMPGVYNLGSSGIFSMQQYVDVEGGGETATTITGNHCTYPEPLVWGASNAEIRSLALENTCGGFINHVMKNAGTSPKVTNVTFTGSSCDLIENVGGGRPVFKNVTVISYSGVGMMIQGGESAVLENVRISASGPSYMTPHGCSSGGLMINSPSPDRPTILNNVVIDASYGEGVTFTDPWPNNGSGGMTEMTNVKISSSAGTAMLMKGGANAAVKIKNSIIKGATGTIKIEVGHASIENTQLDGPLPTAGTQCTGVYDVNSLPLSCP